NTGLITAGYILGEEDRWKTIEDVMGYVQYVVVAVILGAILWFLWSRFVSPSGREQARQRLAAADGDAAHPAETERTDIQS
ncbi:MAG TPA: hypothetical protein VFY82_09820, partial [Acidimicrobiales bacterium]|nr:hypothetical protein [Acidimicrobiales bacterium]